MKHRRSRFDVSFSKLAAAWAESSEAVLAALNTRLEHGLAHDEARRRRRHFGPNQLRQVSRRHIWQILWEQFVSPIVGPLVAAALVALAFDERVDGLAIVAVIFINAGFGFVTERRAVHEKPSMLARMLASAS